MANTKGRSASDLNASNLTVNGGTSKEGDIKYKVDNLTYPLDLSGTPDLQHYVGFFINIRGKSKYMKSYNTTEITATDENRIDRTKLGERFNTVAGAAGAYFGAKMGNTVANKVLGNIGQTSTKTKIISKAVGALAGGYAGYKAATLFEADKMYRISAAIMLAVSERPSVSYGIDYTAQDMGSASGALAGGVSSADASTMGMAAELTRALMLQTAQIPAGIASMAGSNFDPAAMASLGTSTTPNPFREQIFKSVDTREFHFNYKFLPRNAKEAQAVELIIRMFKFHMHPELSAGGLFYIYPSEFNIVYYYKGKENPHINKISTCVLTNMQVDYGGGQGFHSFDDGTPTEINIKLSFRELEILTKERVNIGY